MITTTTATETITIKVDLYLYGRSTRKARYQILSDGVWSDWIDMKVFHLKRAIGKQRINYNDATEVVTQVHDLIDFQKVD